MTIEQAYQILSQMYPKPDISYGQEYGKWDGATYEHRPAFKAWLGHKHIAALDLEGIVSQAFSEWRARIKTVENIETMIAEAKAEGAAP